MPYFGSEFIRDRTHRCWKPSSSAERCKQEILHVVRRVFAELKKASTKNDSISQTLKEKTWSGLQKYLDAMEPLITRFVSRDEGTPGSTLCAFVVSARELMISRKKQNIEKNVNEKWASEFVEAAEDTNTSLGKVGKLAAEVESLLLKRKVPPGASASDEAVAVLESLGSLAEPVTNWFLDNGYQHVADHDRGMLLHDARESWYKLLDLVASGLDGKVGDAMDKLDKKVVGAVDNLLATLSVSEDENEHQMWDLYIPENPTAPLTTLDKLGGKLRLARRSISDLRDYMTLR